MTTRIVEVRTRILKQNDQTARALRARFRAAGVMVVDLVSAPGAGKTELLVRTLEALHGAQRCAAIVGDLATDNDARRLAATGVPARQIETGNICHLEADMVERALGDWTLDQLDYLFIENVGNLVCPASWDLGADARALLMSVTEGEDKPVKYPTLIHTCDIVVLTKLDLAAAAHFDLALARRNIEAVRPGCPVVQVCARADSFDISTWLEWLKRRKFELRQASPSSPHSAA